MTVLEIKKCAGKILSCETMKLEDLIKCYSDLIDEQRAWLKPFSKQRLDKWERELKSDPEAAICEAMTREFLEESGVDVAPNENLSTGGPDFVCSRDVNRFYVEVTHVPKDKVTSKTNLTDKPQNASYKRLLTNVFLDKLCNKASQCSGLDKPCLVAIGTLHCQGGVRCFGKHAIEYLLTSTSSITMRVNPAQGQAIGEPYESADLRDSAFIRYSKTSTGKIEFARNPISAVLLCAFGYGSVKVVGALHPNPNRVFDRMLLPQIKFCRLVEGCIEARQLKVEWI